MKQKNYHNSIRPLKMKYVDESGNFLSGNLFVNLIEELTTFTIQSIGQNLAKMIQRATFLSKTRVDALLFKRENYYTKSDIIRGYRRILL